MLIYLHAKLFNEENLLNAHKQLIIIIQTLLLKTNKKNSLFCMSNVHIRLSF